MCDAVRAPAPEQLLTLVAAVGSGAIVGLSVGLSTDLFAAGPSSQLVAAAVALCGLLLPRPHPRVALIVALGAGLFALSAARAATAVVWLGGYEGLPLAAGILGLGIAWALGAPLRRAPGLSRIPVALAALTFAGVCLGDGSGALPRPVLVLLILLAGVVCARMPHPQHPRPPLALTGVARLLPLLLAAGVGWALLRAPLDPTPGGFLCVATATALGFALAPRSGGRWAGLAALTGGALMAGAGATGWARLDPVLNLDPRAGALILAVFGLGTGLLAGTPRPDARAGVAALLVAALALAPTVRALPATVVARAARADATTWASRERVRALRDRATPVWAGLGAAGAGSVYRIGTHVFGEFDGAFADPDSRSGAAERLAGTLAGCATGGRDRARVGGDDLGLAVEALRVQGFLGIDTAVPDPELARAQAAARPGLERTWLHPSVRLVALPAPAVLRAGPAADAVVEITRSAWTDGRQALPTRSGLAATRASLADGGVHLLALSTPMLTVSTLEGILHAFVEVYPSASLWLPPTGADTALLMGLRDPGPLPWSGFERCTAADPAGLAAVSIKSALDLGALAMADAEALRSLPPGRLPYPGLPATLGFAPGLPLADLAQAEAQPTALFSGAPNTELAARAESRTLFLQLLREATQGDIRDAIDRARTLAEAPGGARALEPLIAPHLARARQAIARGRRDGLSSKAWEEAEAALLTARTLYPRSTATRCLEGELAGHQGQLSRAEEAFAACSEFDPSSLEALDGLARARRSRGNLTGTEEALRAALDRHPERWTTSYNLGCLLFELGRYDDAERLLRQAVAGQSREGQSALEPAPYLSLARLYLATDRAELALAQAQRAATLTRGADALALRGAARYELRQLDDAERDFREALALNPGLAIAHGGLGQVLATRKSYELAAVEFQAVLQIEPNNGPARENLKRLAPLLPKRGGP